MDAPSYIPFHSKSWATPPLNLDFVVEIRPQFLDLGFFAGYSSLLVGEYEL